MLWSINVRRISISAQTLEFRTAFHRLFEKIALDNNEKGRNHGTGPFGKEYAQDAKVC